MDSSATDHLTGSSENIISYILRASNEKIIIVYGSLAPIARTEQIFPFEALSLQNVLHMPKTSYNLLSTSKTTHELNCKATFLPDSVSFQDLSTGRMISIARYSRVLDDDTFARSSSRTSLLSSYFTISE